MDASHPTPRYGSNSARPSENKKKARIPKPSFPSRPKELRQLVRHRDIHLGHVKIIEVLKTADGLSFDQHLLDVRRELGRANGIVVEYLVGGRYSM